MLTDEEHQRAERQTLLLIRSHFSDGATVPEDDPNHLTLQFKLDQMEHEYLTNPDLVAEMLADATTDWRPLGAPTGNFG